MRLHRVDNGAEQAVGGDPEDVVAVHPAVLVEDDQLLAGGEGYGWGWPRQTRTWNTRTRYKSKPSWLPHMSNVTYFSMLKFFGRGEKNIGAPLYPHFITAHLMKFWLNVHCQHKGGGFNDKGVQQHNHNDDNNNKGEVPTWTRAMDKKGN